jgi:putative copper export protein
MSRVLGTASGVVTLFVCARGSRWLRGDSEWSAWDALPALLLAGVPAARRLGTSERGQAVAALVNAFSPTALGFAALVVATGVLAAWLHLGSLAALWASGYGRTLLLKLAAVAVLVAAGAYNWRVMRPALGSDAATGRLRRSAGFELIVSLVVLAVTAVLVATMPGK